MGRLPTALALGLDRREGEREVGSSVSKFSGCAGSWETWSVRREKRGMRGVVGRGA